MWLLNLLPDWIFYLILAIGTIGLLLLKFTPFIPLIYRTAITPVLFLFVVFGIFMSGSIYASKDWIARVKEMESKVAIVEQQSKEENVKIVTKIVKKTEVVKERGQEIIRYVDREVTKYDTKFLPGGECEIPKEFIKSINDAAEKPK
jgi:membrane protein implicated in regulation of membrane protease activity